MGVDDQSRASASSHWNCSDCLDHASAFDRLCGEVQQETSPIRPVDRSAVSRAVQRVEKDPDLIAAARRILGLLGSYTSHH